MAFAGQEIIEVLNRIKYPYNVNILTQQRAVEQLSDPAAKSRWVRVILEQRDLLRERLRSFSSVINILPSDANFLMVKFDNPAAVFHFLTDKKIIVRDRSRVPLCTGYLRITVGSEEENLFLLQALKEYSGQK